MKQDISHSLKLNLKVSLYRQPETQYVPKLTFVIYVNSQEKIDLTLEVFGKADITTNADSQELIQLEGRKNFKPFISCAYTASLQ